MKQYFFPVLGAIIIGAGGAWVLTTGATLAYRGMLGKEALNYTVQSKLASVVASSATKEQKTGYYKLKNSALPELSARAFLLADLDTGEVLAGRELETIYPIASITKLMTSLVALESISQTSLITVSERDLSTSGEAGGLVLGEKFTAQELLYPLLLESSNDAAEALARYYGREGFISLMNDKAKRLGLKQTTFTDPSGLDENNRSSARDLFTFANYLYRGRSYPLAVTQLTQKRYGSHLWLNNNHLANLTGFLGGKTGQTSAARQTLVSLMNLEFSENVTRPMAIILLQSENRDQDVAALLNYLKETFTYRS